MPAVQGDRIDGTNGTWECETDHTARPESIKIKFTPKGTVRCKDIRLTQQVKAFGLDKDGKRVAKENGELYKDPADNPHAWEEPDSVLNPGGVRVYIDHLKCEGDPYYNGDDPQDTKSRGDGSTRPPTPTGMSDSPGVDFSNKKDEIVEIHKNFETCAVCAETGEILGCIWWSSISTRRHPGQIVIHTGGHDEPGSNTMKKALKKFIQRHTRRGADGKLHWFCPEDGTERGALPGNFDKSLLAARAGTLGGPRVSEGELASTAERLITIPRAIAGGGRVAPGDLVLDRAMARPDRAAIKLTWAGEQEKSVLGVVLTPFAELTAVHVAPFVEDDDRYANDFQAIRVVPISSASMTKALAAARAPLARGREGAPAILTVIAGLGTGAATGSSAALAEADVMRLATRLRRSADEPGFIEAVNYLALNMGGATEV